MADSVHPCLACGACCAACGIYEWRPNPCRELEPGSHGCEKARARHGLPPLAAQML